MALTTLSMVWTEREGDVPGTPANEGDWEACVATSYSMALLHAGVSMAAPYTQRQRELLEVVADEPQNLTQTDAKSLEVYGKKLRPPTAGLTNTQALARPGVGMCLTGTGSPNGIVSGTFTHEIFWLGENATNGWVYDPLAPYGSAPVQTSVARIAVWARPLSATNAREIRAGELSGGTIPTNMPVIESLKGYPPGTTVPFVKGKEYQFFAYDSAGNRTSMKAVYAGDTAAPTEALVDLTGDGPAHFIPRVYVPPVGYRNNLYLPIGYADAVYPPTGDPDAVADAVAARDKEWEAKINASLHP